MVSADQGVVFEALEKALPGSVSQAGKPVPISKLVRGSIWRKFLIWWSMRSSKKNSTR
jgi:hypothetical protein